MKNENDVSNTNLQSVYGIRIEDLGISVRTYNTVKRGGYDSVGDLANATVEELSEIRNMNDKCLNQVLTTLAERGIFVPKEADLSEVEVLRRKIIKINRENDRLERWIQLNKNELEEEKKSIDYAIKELKKKNILNAKKRSGEKKNAVSAIIEEMEFPVNGQVGLPFCTVFNLYDRGCLVEDSTSNLNTACQECIDNFILDYYLKMFHSEMLQSEKSDTKAVLDLHRKEDDTNE